MTEKVKYGQQVLVLLLLFLGMFFVSSLLSVGASMLFGLSMTNASVMLFFQSLSQIMVFFMPPIILGLIYHYDLKSVFQLDFGAKKWGRGLIGIVILVLSIPMIDWLTQWNDGWHFAGPFAEVERVLREMGENSAEIVQQLLAADNVGQLAISLFVIAFLPAVCEELFFRGALQSLLQKWFGGPHIAIWATAVIFSLCHGEIFAFMPRLLLGALLGYLFYYGESIVVNMLVHFANNAMAVIAYNLYMNGEIGWSPDQPMNFMWQWVALFTVAAVAMLYVNFIMDRKTSKK